MEKRLDALEPEALSPHTAVSSVWAPTGLTAAAAAAGRFQASVALAALADLSEKSAALAEAEELYDQALDVRRRLARRGLAIGESAVTLPTPSLSIPVETPDGGWDGGCSRTAETLAGGGCRRDSATDPKILVLEKSIGAVYTKQAAELDRTGPAVRRRKDAPSRNALEPEIQLMPALLARSDRQAFGGGGQAAAAAKRGLAKALLTKVRDGFMLERGAEHSDTVHAIELLRRI